MLLEGRDEERASRLVESLKGNVAKAEVIGQEVFCRVRVNTGTNYSEHVVVVTAAAFCCCLMLCHSCSMFQPEKHDLVGVVEESRLKTMFEQHQLIMKQFARGDMKSNIISDIERELNRSISNILP